MKKDSSKFDWIFFDIGGPLIDDSAAVKQRIEINLRVLREFKPELARTDILKVWPQACARLGSVDQNLAVLLIEEERRAKQAFKEVIRQKGLATPYLELVRVRPEAAAICARLAASYRLGFIANQASAVRKLLADAGVLPHFSHQKVSDDYKLEKPDPKFYQRVLDETKANPSRSVMIDDNIERSLLPAKKFGMTTVWYKLAERTIPERSCDYVIRSLIQLLALFPHLQRETNADQSVRAGRVVY